MPAERNRNRRRNHYRLFRLLVSQAPGEVRHSTYDVRLLPHLNHVGNHILCGVIADLWRIMAAY